MHNTSLPPFLWHPPPPPPQLLKIYQQSFFLCTYKMTPPPPQPCKHIFTTENIPYRNVQIYQGCKRKGVSSKQLHNFFFFFSLSLSCKRPWQTVKNGSSERVLKSMLTHGFTGRTHSSAILDKLLTSQAVQINVSIMYRNHILSRFFQLTAYVIFPQRQHWYKYVGNRGTPDLFTTTVPLWGSRSQNCVLSWKMVCTQILKKRPFSH